MCIQAPSDKLSIVICTRNRASDLAKTLDSFRQVYVPKHRQTELLVVDNASSDNTAEVVRQAQLPFLTKRYICETTKGLSQARNRAIAETTGAILLWTDDDIIPPHNWIEGMCAPILSGKTHAVAGGVRIAPHLERPWMQDAHRQLLASTIGLDSEEPKRLVGANMAFSREVLTCVPAFDTELGAGALGFCEETLFTKQLQIAGYKVATALDIAVEHHFDPARLTRESFVDAARKRGRSHGYLAHHWEHAPLDFSPIRLYRLWRYLKFSLRSAEPKTEYGISANEMGALCCIAEIKQQFIERKKKPNYDKHGLIKKKKNYG